VKKAVVLLAGGEAAGRQADFQHFDYDEIEADFGF
jgi:hypothetical protein